MPVQQVGPRPITLLDLATYSAGMPRDMGDAPAGRAQRTWPTRAERWRWLAGNPLRWAPGTVAAYSNVGFDLIADALEEATGQLYPALLRDRVTAPAGMTDTTATPTPEQCARLMIGTGLGGAGACVDTTATAASGGLYSTGNDMLLWLRRNMQDPDGTLALSHAVYRQRQAMAAAIGFDDAAPMSGLGLGWVISEAAGTAAAAGGEERRRGRVHELCGVRAGAGCGPVRGGEPARFRALRGADGRGERLGGEPRHTLTRRSTSPPRPQAVHADRLPGPHQHHRRRSRSSFTRQRRTLQEEIVGRGPDADDDVLEIIVAAARSACPRSRSATRGLRPMCRRGPAWHRPD